MRDGWQIGRRVTGGGLLAILAAVLLSGCEATASKAKRVASGAGEVVSAVDPTGTVRRNVEIGAASAALQARLDEVDIESLNSTVACLGDLAYTLRERVDSLGPEVTEMVSAELRVAQLEELSQSLQALAAESSEQLSKLDVDAVNKLIADAQAQVTEIDMDKANQLVEEFGALQPQLDEVLRKTAAALDQIERAAAVLPVAETEATLQAVRQSAVGLRRSTRGLSVTVWLANALLVMLCVCSVVWLRKARR